MAGLPKGSFHSLDDFEDISAKRFDFSGWFFLASNHYFYCLFVFPQIIEFTIASIQRLSLFDKMMVISSFMIKCLGKSFCSITLFKLVPISSIQFLIAKGESS